VLEDAVFFLSWLFYDQQGAEDADWVLLWTDLECELLCFGLCCPEAVRVAVGGCDVEGLEFVVWG
jgi:hypothetical protein